MAEITTGTALRVGGGAGGGALPGTVSSADWRRLAGSLSWPDCDGVTCKRLSVFPGGPRPPRRRPPAASAPRARLALAVDDEESADEHEAHGPERPRHAPPPLGEPKLEPAAPADQQGQQAERRVG